MWWATPVQEIPDEAPDQQRAAYTVHRRPHRRRYQTARDMLLSLGAIGISVAVILGITYRSKPDPVHVVDSSAAITDVKILGHWPVIDPSSHLVGWRLTVARHDSTSGGEPVLALGWVTPSSHWVGLQESAAAGVDARRWRDSFLPSTWRDAVEYPNSSWRAFGDVAACTQPCTPATAPLAYAQVNIGTAPHRAVYIAYGDAPILEIKQLMAAITSARMSAAKSVSPNKV
jgi:hypothetical protein